MKVLYIRADSAATPRRQPYQSQYEGNKPLSSLPSNAALRRAVVGQIQIFEFKFKYFGLSDDIRPYRKSTRAAAVGRLRRKVDRGRAPQG